MTKAFELAQLGDKVVVDGSGNVSVDGGTLFVDAANNQVGIGTSSPVDKLQINGGFHVTGAFSDVSNGGGGVITSFAANAGSILSLDPQVAWKNLDIGSALTTFSTLGGERLRIDASGNLLVGTTSALSPNAGLGSKEVSVKSSVSADFVLDNTEKTGGIKWSLSSGSNGTAGSGFFNVYDGTSAAERLRITSTGSVGIGTSSPSAGLHVNGGAFGSGTGYQLMVGYLGGSENYYDANTQIFRDGSANERMRITSTGLVGIGDTAPVAPLHVNGENALGLTAWFGNNNSYINNAGYHYTDARVGISGRDSDGTDNGAGIEYLVRNTANSNFFHGYTVFNRDGAYVFGLGGSGVTQAVERMRITSTGSVGIGTSSPATQAHVSSTSVSGLTLERNVSGAGASTTLQPIIFSGPDSGSANANHAYAKIDSITTSITNGSESAALRFFTSGSGTLAERLRIDASGNVGIGISNPLAALHVVTSTTDYVGDVMISGTRPYLVFDDTTVGQNGFSIGVDGGAVTFGQGDFSTNSNVFGTERMRLDPSGSLLVGATESNPASGNVAGVRLSSANSQFSANGATPVFINRKTSDGTIIDFRKDGAATGSISTEGADLIIGTGVAGLRFFDQANAIIPRIAGGGGSDGVISLGQSAQRFDDVYATNGTIQTSDRNEKQDIEALSDAEQRVAVACKGLLRKFRWKSAVEEKGDDARIHFGIIAQDLQAAFEAEGLDAGRYAMFISSTWTDEETGEERSRMGVRYPQLLAFIIAAI